MVWSNHGWVSWMIDDCKLITNPELSRNDLAFLQREIEARPVLC
jgi:hypothetical protein